MKLNNQTISVKAKQPALLNVVKGNLISTPSDLEKKCQDILDKYSQKSKVTAKKELQQLITSHPQESIVQHLYSVIQYKERKYQAAYTAIKKAIKLAHGSSAQFNLCGLIQRKLKLFELAMTSYKKAIDKNKKFADPYNNLAIIYRYFGRSKIAVNLFKKALELKPNYPTAFYNLSCINNYILTGDEILSVKKYLKTTQDSSDRARLNFSLYNAFSKNKKYRRAFNYLNAGNALVYKKLAYVDEIQTYVKKLRRIYDLEYYQSFRKLALSQKVPVFIVGMPRCGSSLLEQMLDSHYQVSGIGESRLMPIMMESLYKYINRDVEVFCKTLGGLTEVELVNARNRYSKSLATIVGEEPFYTDKMLFNFKYIGFIKILLPNAKFIHMRRNPMDLCLGCYEKKFTDGHEYSYSLKSLANYYVSYDLMMTHWSNIFQDDILKIDYEELVSSPEFEIKKCLSFLSLEMDSSCLDFYKSDRNVFTASTDQVREKISTRSVGRWRHYEQQLQPVIDEFEKSGIDYLRNG